MNILTKIIRRAQNHDIKNKYYVTILGPSNAGKTTLIRYTESGQAVKSAPSSTFGIDIRNKSFYEDSEFQIKIIDTSGQENLSQMLWEVAIQHANAIILLIDATVRPETFENIFTSMVKQINYALDIIPENQILLFLLNKHDLTDLNPIQKHEVLDLYKLKDKIHKIPAENILIHEISAKFGTGVNHCLNWLRDRILYKSENQSSQ